MLGELYVVDRRQYTPSRFTGGRKRKITSRLRLKAYTRRLYKTLITLIVRARIWESVLLGRSQDSSIMSGHALAAYRSTCVRSTTSYPNPSTVPQYPECTALGGIVMARTTSNACQALLPEHSTPCPRQVKGGSRYCPQHSRESAALTKAHENIAAKNEELDPSELSVEDIRVLDKPQVEQMIQMHERYIAFLDAELKVQATQPMRFFGQGSHLCTVLRLYIHPTDG